VQGEHAARSVAGAIGTLTRRTDIDVVVVIRGGGARNELATFDDEQIAIAIATSPLPVLTGLGHEIDVSVADEVAHRSLKTPTACAAALVDAVADFRHATEQRWTAIAARARRRHEQAHGALSERAHRVARQTHAAVERADERLTTRHSRLRATPIRQLDAAATHLANSAQRLVVRVPHIVEGRARDLDAAAARLQLLDPNHMLRRGWSITRGPDGELVRSTSQLVVGASITTQVIDGTITSRIEEP
jgi:exodeoxyribonuclease VII large subunit